MVGHLTEFAEKKLQSVGKGDVELGTEDERKAAEDERKAKSEAHATLLESVQTALDEHVKEVRLSSRLTSSAACLVGEEFDMSPGLMRMFEQSGQTMPSQKRILELNPNHTILGKLQTIFDATPDDELVIDYAHLLHGPALIAEGSELPDPAGFGTRVAALMVDQAEK